jgi:hypothetical protein
VRGQLHVSADVQLGRIISTSLSPDAEASLREAAQATTTA